METGADTFFRAKIRDFECSRQRGKFGQKVDVGFANCNRKSYSEVQMMRHEMRVKQASASPKYRELRETREGFFRPSCSPTCCRLSERVQALVGARRCDQWSKI